MSSLARELEFRVNFFAKVCLSLTWLGFFVITLLVIYRNTPSVAGWNKGDGFVLAGCAYFLDSFYRTFFFSLTEIPSQIRLGTLDFIVTRPLESQFWVSLRKVGFEQFGSVFAGIGLILVGINITRLHPTLIDWSSWLVLLICAQAIFYSLNLSLMTLSIWLVRVDNIEILSEVAAQFSRNPLDIFGKSIQLLFLYAIPIGFLGTMPAEALTKGFSVQMTFVGILWMIVALFVSRRFWKYATTHYSSASA